MYILYRYNKKLVLMNGLFAYGIIILLSHTTELSMRGGGGKGGVREGGHGGRGGGHAAYSIL